jgi:hypothetical protein
MFCMCLRVHPQVLPHGWCLLQEFYTDLRDAEREGEVNRVLAAFKLNPFEQMNLRFDATSEEVRRQYRKVGATADQARHGLPPWPVLYLWG